MHSLKANSQGIVRGAILAILGAVVVVAGLSYLLYCPCDRTPGGWLLGEAVVEPVTDWSFANEVPLCQFQVGSWLPHSVNLNCMSSKGKLYLSCSRCDGKFWSGIALEVPEARIRMAGKVYPVIVSRVEDSQTLDEAWTARAAKLGRPEDTPRADGWWSFEIESR
ncbi:MAG: hypothetical protein O7F71_10005 [Gammaproteobacteria bacterium]|nr:hypothetical protein [Gammaproteobacteria bacterium]